MNEILENTAKWKQIPPIISCFTVSTTFRKAPLEIDHSAFPNRRVPPPEQRKSFLEGFWIYNRLAVVYSDRDFSALWSDSSEPTPQVRLGINLVVFALTQPGGMAGQDVKATAR